jgi:hypothetical protein
MSKYAAPNGTITFTLLLKLRTSMRLHHAGTSVPNLDPHGNLIELVAPVTADPGVPGR